MNRLLSQYPAEVQRILAKYPADFKRSAVMPLLYLAQRDHGYVSKQDMEDIGQVLEISSTDVASIVGFYTLYHEKPEGKHRIQVCNDLPCALRGADAFLANLCENLGIQVGGTTEDGLVTVEAVMCLAACDKAPMFQVQDSAGIAYHEHQTVASTLALIERWRNPDAAAPEAVVVETAPVESAPVAEVAPAEPAAPDIAVEPPPAAANGQEAE